MPAPVTATRNPTIDTLRGIAISLVMLLHFHLSYSLVDSPLALLLPEDAIQAVARNGNYGVTMFFVISGYLITGTTLRRHGELGKVDLWSFYAFRFARIMPGLVLALLIILGLGLAGQPAFMNIAKPGWPEVGFPLALLSVLTFWHNVLMQHAWYFNYAMNIYWSLSVEEMFYLLFPMLCVALRRAWALAAICLVAIVIGPLYRSHHADDEIRFLYAYPACFDAIAFGCCAALLAERWRVGGKPALLLRLLAALLVAVTYLRGIRGHETFGFTLIAFGTAALLVVIHGEAPRRPAHRNPFLAAIRWMGRHSYELYLFHIIVLGLMRGAWPRGTLAYGDKGMAMAAFVGLSALAAWTVARFYTEPLNARLRQAFRRPEKSPLRSEA
nr:acyltransferase [uncultured Roseococcus sp.]